MRRRRSHTVIANSVECRQACSLMASRHWRVLRFTASRSESQLQSVVAGCFDWDPFATHLPFDVTMVRQDVEALIAEGFALLQPLDEQSLSFVQVAQRRRRRTRPVGDAPHRATRFERLDSEPGRRQQPQAPGTPRGDEEPCVREAVGSPRPAPRSRTEILAGRAG